MSTELSTEVLAAEMPSLPSAVLLRPCLPNRNIDDKPCTAQASTLRSVQPQSQNGGANVIIINGTWQGHEAAARVWMELMCAGRFKRRQASWLLCHVCLSSRTSLRPAASVDKAAAQPAADLRGVACAAVIMYGDIRFSLNKRACPQASGCTCPRGQCNLCCTHLG